MATLEEMIREVHDNLGQPTDLDIYDDDGEFDISQEGSRKFRGWLNAGVQRICGWRTPRHEVVRFSSLFQRVNFQARVFEADVEEISEQSVTIEEESDFVVQEAQPENWILEIKGQKFLVVSYEDLTVYTDRKIGESLKDAETVKFYKREWRLVRDYGEQSRYDIRLDPNTEIDTIQRVTLLQPHPWQIHRGLRTDYHPYSMVETGTPSAYFVLGNTLAFDVAPDRDMWFMLEYYAMPEPMKSIFDEPGIPVRYHEAVVLYATWKGLRRYQEWDGAFATKRDLDEYMQKVRDSYALNDELEDGYLWIE